ncbi:hypothetical protein NX059_009093 [Plenodomus lindquistii]|nr:hypothetical protein NX059_009093 [Plenodomus lindquistii]
MAQDRYYCLDNQTEPVASSDICSSSTYFFEMAGTPSTVTIIGVTQTTSREASTTSDIRSTTASPTSTNSSPPGLSQRASSSPTTSRTLFADQNASSTSVSSISPSFATANSSAASEATEKFPSKDYSIAIGLGVGIPLGVLAIVIIALLIFRHRRHRRNAALVPPQYTGPHQPYDAMKPDVSGTWGATGPGATVYHEAEWVQPVPQELPVGDDVRKRE